jgi:hypothetical protein
VRRSGPPGCGSLIVEAQGPDLGLELLDHGPMPALNGPAALARIGFAMAEFDGEPGAGEGELVGAVGGPIVDIQGIGQTLA